MFSKINPLFTDTCGRGYSASITLQFPPLVSRLRWARARDISGYLERTRGIVFLRPFSLSFDDDDDDDDFTTVAIFPGIVFLPPSRPRRLCRQMISIVCGLFSVAFSISLSRARLRKSGTELRLRRRCVVPLLLFLLYCAWISRESVSLSGE